MNWQQRYSERTYPHALGESLIRHLQHDHGMSLSAVDYIANNLDEHKKNYLDVSEIDSQSPLSTIERKPDESAEEFAHRFVHDIRGGEWAIDEIYGDPFHRHAANEEVKKFPALTTKRDLLRHLISDHGMWSINNNTPVFQGLIDGYGDSLQHHEEMHNGSIESPSLSRVWNPVQRVLPFGTKNTIHEHVRPENLKTDELNYRPHDETYRNILKTHENFKGIVEGQGLKPTKRLFRQYLQAHKAKIKPEHFFEMAKIDQSGWLGGSVLTHYLQIRQTHDVNNETPTHEEAKEAIQTIPHHKGCWPEQQYYIRNRMLGVGPTALVNRAHNKENNLQAPHQPDWWKFQTESRPDQSSGRREYGMTHQEVMERYRLSKDKDE